jgi:opacity protein-like surface antigen
MKRLVVIGVMCLMVTGFARTAAAQDDPAKVEIGGGWQYQSLRINDDESWEHFKYGWWADGAFHLTGMFSAVAQVSGMYKTLVEQEGEIDISVHPYLGGVRVTSRRNPKAAIFGQFLVGAATLKASFGSDDESQTMFAYQVGGGANVAISGRLAARVGGDYLRIMPSGDDGPLVSEALHGFRLSAGLVYGFGG